MVFTAAASATAPPIALAEATFEGGFMSSFSQKNVADPKNKIPFHKGAVKAYKELGLME